MRRVINVTIFAIYIIVAIFLIVLLKDVLITKELAIILVFVIITELIFIYLIKHDILLFFSYPAIFFALICLFIFNIKSINLITFAENVSTTENIVNSYKLVTLKGRYKKIDNLKNMKIGYLNEMKKFSNLDIKYKSIKYEKIAELINDLEKERIAAAILLDNQYSFDNTKYDIICNLEVSEEIIPVINNNSDTSLIYVTALDNSDSDKSVINMLFGINKKTKQIIMINIPEDYYVFFPEQKDYDKISDVGIYGISLGLKVVEKLFENKIDYYLKIDNKSLANLIDKLGPINVESDYNFISSGVEFDKGLNRLNGNDTILFMYEKVLNNSRIEAINQSNVIEIVIKRLLNNNDFEILDELKKVIRTNIPDKKIKELIKNQILYNYRWNITKYNLDGTDKFAYTYSYKCCKLLVIEPDMITINNAITMIEYLKKDGIFN